MDASGTRVGPSAPRARTGYQLFGSSSKPEISPLRCQSGLMWSARCCRSRRCSPMARCCRGSSQIAGRPRPGSSGAARSMTVPGRARAAQWAAYVSAANRKAKQRAVGLRLCRVQALGRRSEISGCRTVEQDETTVNPDSEWATADTNNRNGNSIPAQIWPLSLATTATITLESRS